MGAFLPGATYYNQNPCFQLLSEFRANWPGVIFTIHFKLVVKLWGCLSITLLCENCCQYWVEVVSFLNEAHLFSVVMF